MTTDAGTNRDEVVGKSAGDADPDVVELAADITMFALGGAGVAIMVTSVKYATEVVECVLKQVPRVARGASYTLCG